MPTACPDLAPVARLMPAREVSEGSLVQLWPNLWGEVLDTAECPDGRIRISLRVPTADGDDLRVTRTVRPSRPLMVSDLSPRGNVIPPGPFDARDLLEMALPWLPLNNPVRREIVAFLSNPGAGRGR